MAKKNRQTAGDKPNSLSLHTRRSAQRRHRQTAVSARPSLSKRGRAASGINKSAFVRSLPGSLSAADVIEKGKAKGIKLSAAQVYTIRANARRKGPDTALAFADLGERGGARGSGAAVRGGRGSQGQGRGGAKEAEFIAAALDLGLARAEALIRALRAKASAGWS